jgi:hypothetical protein
LKAAKAKDSLILPAAASPPGMAAANASLAQHPEIAKTELSQMETTIGDDYLANVGEYLTIGDDA